MVFIFVLEVFRIMKFKIINDKILKMIKSVKILVIEINIIEKNVLKFINKKNFIEVYFKVNIKFLKSIKDKIIK